MESTLLNSLIVLVLGTMVYCVALALGFDGSTIVDAARPYAWLLAGGLAIYLTIRITLLLRRRASLSRGDRVIYYKPKYSEQPGPRAEHIQPAEHGEGYSYVVRKPWTVVRAEDNEKVEVVTNGGKHHVLEADDPKLHRAGLLETLAMRLRWHKDFPSPDA